MTNREKRYWRDLGIDWQEVEAAQRTRERAEYEARWKASTPKDRPRAVMPHGLGLMLAAAMSLGGDKR